MPTKAEVEAELRVANAKLAIRDKEIDFLRRRAAIGQVLRSVESYLRWIKEETSLLEKVFKDQTGGVE